MSWSSASDARYTRQCSNARAGGHSSPIHHGIHVWQCVEPIVFRKQYGAGDAGAGHGSDRSGPECGEPYGSSFIPKVRQDLPKGRPHGPPFGAGEPGHGICVRRPQARRAPPIVSPSAPVSDADSASRWSHSRCGRRGRRSSRLPARSRRRARIGSVHGEVGTVHSASGVDEDLVDHRDRTVASNLEQEDLARGDAPACERPDVHVVGDQDDDLSRR